MIARIKGTLISKSPEKVVVDAGGIGYEVNVPLSAFSKLPEIGEVVTLTTVTFFKDENIRIYGFLEEREKDMFLHLITVSGIGPKLARNIISGASIDNLVNTIAGGDSELLRKLPGVGKKTAERLLLELKDKVIDMGGVALEAGTGAAVLAGGGLITDVLSALKNLGYKAAEAEEAVKKIKDELTEDEGFEAVFKKAMKAMTRKS